MAEPFYKSYLQSELSRRCERNPRYSVRAFARALDINDGALSQILSGKRIPAYRTAVRIIRALDLTPEEEQSFLGSLAEKHRSRGLQRLNPIFREIQSKPRQHQIDLFRMAADWYHVAIGELTLTDGFQSDPTWIARELGISVIEAKMALERLVNYGYLEVKDGKFVRLKPEEQIVFSGGAETYLAARRTFHRQLLEKAVHSLENDDPAVRDFTCWTVAIDPEKLNEARTLIETFMSDLSTMLESGKRKKVYHMEFCLFPLQTNPEKKS
jgi:uncharacterized protein (TIGR02147 family)